MIRKVLFHYAQVRLNKEFNFWPSDIAQQSPNIGHHSININHIYPHSQTPLHASSCLHYYMCTVCILLYYIIIIMWRCWIGSGGGGKVLGKHQLTDFSIVNSGSKKFEHVVVCTYHLHTSCQKQILIEIQTGWHLLQ